jgi:signal transduction histidine kinase
VRTPEYGPEAAGRPWPRPPASWLAVPIAVFQVIGSHFASENQPFRLDLDALGIALLLAGPAALLLRRRHPVPVLVIVMVATLAYLLVGYPYGPVFISLVVAFFSAVIAGYRTAAWVVAGSGYVGYLALSFLPGGEPAASLGQATGLAAWLLAVLAVSEVIRARRESFAEAARTRAEEARRRAGEERLRIARELHDVLAHNISLINVQAGVALHLIDEQPEQARTALAAIKQASKEALGELRSVLDVLRHGEDGAPRSPAPGLAQLDELVGRATAAGIPVRTTVTGAQRALPTSVDLAAYRIVQEALTNVVRHAGPARAAVTLTYADDALAVQVDDDGRAAAAIGPEGTGGRGILGMRERVSALGGRLEAGARPEGGFRVLAWLPLDGDS